MYKIPNFFLNTWSSNLANIFYYAWKNQIRVWYI